LSIWKKSDTRSSRKKWGSSDCSFRGRYMISVCPDLVKNDRDLKTQQGFWKSKRKDMWHELSARSWSVAIWPRNVECQDRSIESRGVVSMGDENSF
jgi:hypothetical protein